MDPGWALRLAVVVRCAAMDNLPDFHLHLPELSEPRLPRFSLTEVHQSAPFFLE